MHLPVQTEVAVTLNHSGARVPCTSPGLSNRISGSQHTVGGKSLENFKFNLKLKSRASEVTVMRGLPLISREFGDSEVSSQCKRDAEGRPAGLTGTGSLRLVLTRACQ